MQTVFLELVKLSLIGSLFAVAVMLVRLVFLKAPKWLFCILWGVVALRLICPVSIESNVSLVPDRLATGQIITNVGNEYIGDVDIIYESNAEYSDAVEAGRQPIYSNDGYYVVTEKDSLEAPKTVGQTVYPVLSWIWVAGMILMLTYTTVSYLLLRKKMEEATRLRDNIWQCEQADSPFVLGFIKPRIYLPYAISDPDMANVIAHEQAHIQRKDHWWKPGGFLLLSIHWFNPVLWLAYILLCRDIEAACDEKVIKHMEKDEMRAYSTALLHCSIHRRRIAACPLAFGEVGVKERIKRVMNYKKPAFWIIVTAVVICVAVAICFLTNPSNDSQTHNAGSSEVQTLSLNDVIAFSEKGDKLTWSDFDQYKYYETGSGLYIRVYPIDEVFEVWIGGTAPGSNVDPMYIDLTLVNDTNLRTDIRDGGAAEFISRYSFYMPTETNSPDGETDKRTSPITIVSNGEKITPYFHFAYSGNWDGTHFLCGDGIYVGSILPQLASDGLIPCGEYSGDFHVVLGENARISDVLVFDENFNSLDDLWDISHLSMLKEGNYYVGIVVYIEGDYIEEVNRNEYTGRVCVFQLSVKPDAANVPPEEAFDIAVSYANWGDLNEIYSKALNTDEMMQSMVMHLPIYKFDTLAELEQFKNDIQDTLTIDQSYDEVPSFNEVTAKYDEKFFEENTLMLVYVEAGSGSFRYGVNSIYHADGIFCIHVEQTNNPEVFTEDMAGWFITVAVPDRMVADCTAFDADLNNFMR